MIYSLLLLSSVACRNKDLVIGEEINGGDAIVLSASTVRNGVEGTVTRAGIIDGHGKETAFEKNTRLTLLMVSENKDNSADKKYTVTYGLALGNGKAAGDDDNVDTKSTISFATTKTQTVQNYEDPSHTETVRSQNINEGDGRLCYWNDAHDRKSIMSIYGFAVNGTILPHGAPWYQRINGKQNIVNNGWETMPNDFDYQIGREDNGNKIRWTIGQYLGSSNDFKAQSFVSLLYKDDLSYSNNLTGANRLEFNASTKQFTTGTMKFNRAMSMLSFKIQLGEGFDASSSENFSFKNGNVALKGFYKQGYLNIKDGDWEDCTICDDAVYNGQSGYSWNKIANVTEGKTIDQIDDHTYYLLALVIPGTDLTTSGVADAVTFQIDNDVYKVSMQQLYDAIKANDNNVTGSVVKEDVLVGGTKLKAGNNYEFTFTIAKSKVGITAKLVDWETATMQMEGYTTGDNMKISLSDAGTTLTGTPSFDLYTSAKVSDSYSADIPVTVGNNGYSGYTKWTVSETSTAGIYQTQHYWPSSKTYYHFRTLSPTNTSVLTDESTDYFDILGGSLVSPVTSIDYQWGAPFKTTPSCNSDNSGFKTISYAIGPTKDQIKILQFHMTSHVFVDLLTSDGSDAVTLAGATVKLTNAYQNAKVKLGDGAIYGHSSSGDITMSSDHHDKAGDIPEYDYSYAIVPQMLTGNGSGTGKVGIVITLADGNQYTIEDLSKLTTTVSGNKQAVETWNPGKKYYYKFKLTKTGIEPLQATIKDWETVSANYDDVTIE